MTEQDSSRREETRRLLTFEVLSCDSGDPNRLSLTRRSFKLSVLEADLKLAHHGFTKYLTCCQIAAQFQVNIPIVVEILRFFASL